jgi:hypothetical protein
VRIVIVTKLLVSWDNYFKMIIIQCFSVLMSSNFLEFVSESFMPIVNISNLAHRGVVYMLNS